MEFNEFTASIFEAQAAQSAAIHNRVIENAETELTEWKQRFVSLFDMIATENQVVDSVRIDRVLARFDYWAGQAYEGGN